MAEKLVGKSNSMIISNPFTLTFMQQRAVGQKAVVENSVAVTLSKPGPAQSSEPQSGEHAIAMSEIDQLLGVLSSDATVPEWLTALQERVRSLSLNHTNEIEGIKQAKDSENQILERRLLKLKQENIEDSKNSESRMHTLRQQKDSEIQALKKEKHNTKFRFEVELRNLTLLLNRLQVQKEDAERTLQEDEKLLAAQEVQIRSMQEGAFRSVDAAQFAPLANSQITRRLTAILAEVKRWSEKYSKLPLEYILEPDRWKDILALLSRKACIHPTTSLRDKLAKSAPMQKPGRASTLLLAAMISADIFHKIVGNPFFPFAGEVHQGDILHAKDGDGIKHLLDLVVKCNEAGGEAWRCQLIRLLDSNSDTGNSVLRTMTEKSRQTAVDELLQDKITELVDVLIPASESKMALAELQVIALGAANFASNLWSQKTRLQVMGLKAIPGLSEDKDQRLAFPAKFDLLEPHALHSRTLDDNPAALNGRETVLLCSPAIVAYGTADGVGYDKFRVWKQAVVWLG